MDINGKIALVTGAAQGIGREIALALATDGADVSICDVNLEAAQKTSGDIEAMGRRSLAIKANVASSAEVTAMVDQVVEKFGRIDILVNNAGITRDGLLMNMEDEQFDVVINVNLKSVFMMTRAVSRYMIRARYGRIVNIASVSGMMGNAGQANYAASKAGVIGFTKTTAKELGKRGVTANAVAPGFIDTDMTRVLPDKIKEGVKQIIPVQKFGQPQDVAAAVAFLASPAAGYITGQVVPIDGGLNM
jgi:3-oxoacyl-[acyl-carrier protein] reductase